MTISIDVKARLNPSYPERSNPNSPLIANKIVPMVRIAFFILFIC